MYKTEADFSRAITQKLKSHGCVITRIESHGTGNGIPDMYVQYPDFDCWIELKNTKASIFERLKKISWRPGQQSWMLEYKHMHNKRCCLTIVACADGYIIIRNHRHYIDNVVPIVNPADCHVYTKLSDVNLIDEIMNMSTCFRARHETIRETIVAYADSLFKHDFDYDAAVIWNQALSSFIAYTEQPCYVDVDAPYDFDVFSKMRYWVHKELVEQYRAYKINNRN